MKSLKIFLSGIFVGGTMTVPGVSGGTMAIVIGIYEKLLYAINNIKKNPKENIIFLLKFLLGAGVGFLIFARIITTLLDSELLGAFVRFFFCGIVIGGVPLLVSKSKVKKIDFLNGLCLVIGVIIVLALSMLPEGGFTGNNIIYEIIMQFVGGFIVAVALILPGISATHMLYVLGLYTQVLEKIYNFRILQLIPLMIGLLLGTLLTAKWLEQLIEKYTTKVYLTIIGFVMGSVVSLLKGVVVMNVISYFMFIPGFIIMYLLCKNQMK
ncbi:MAG: DUF368 domain-containing protein [Lachnospiraceae bacterium]|nr:DUF368 domain-containing protein [Lachnospiraceae bacterium]